MGIVSTKEYYLIVDRGGTASVGELVNGLNLHLYIHVSRWCVMDWPVKSDFVMEILGVIFVLVKKYGIHEAFPISSC